MHNNSIRVSKILPMVSLSLAFLTGATALSAGTAYGAPISGLITRSDTPSIPITRAAICSDMVPHDIQKEIGERIELKDKMHLDKGTVLVVPSKDTVVETKFCTVHINANSVVLLAMTDTSVSVYDLEDRHKKSVMVTYQGKQLSLSPAHHVLFATGDQLDFTEVNPLENIAHRSLVTQQVTPDLTMYRSEYSIASAIDSVISLRKLFGSRDSATNKLCNRILKTSAILQLSRVNCYQYYLRPATVVKR